MNRIFRRVWNVTLQQWVVASELATGHRPVGMSARLSSAVGSARVRGLPLAALCVALFSAPLAAQEFTVTDGTTPAVVGDGGTVTFTGDPNIRVTQSGVDDDASIEIQLAPDLVVDSLTTGATLVDTNGVAIGSTVLGANGLMLGAGAPSITTSGINAGGLAISGVAAGTAADQAVNFSQLQAVEAQAGAGWNVAVGANAYNIAPDGVVTFSGDANLGVALTGADDAAGVALTLNRNLAVDSVTTGTTVMSGTGIQVGSAVRLSSTGLTITNGPSVTTSGINAGGRAITNVADGAVSAASTEAVNGRQIFALRQELFVEGEGVKYFHANSTLADSRSEGLESVAIGPRTVAQGNSSLAAGDGAATTIGATAGIAIGQGATVGTVAAVTPDGVGAVAIGRDAAASGTSTIALGDGARIGSEFVSNALAIGTGARVTGAQSNNATAIGVQANATAGNATALGALATASGGGSIAIGQASASGGNTFAAGNGAQAASPNGIALGTGAGVGTSGTEAGDRTSHIAIGTGAGTTVVGNQTTAIGFQAGTGVLGDQNIAIGSQAGTAVEGDFNIAIGYRANQNVGEIDRGTALGALASTTSDSVAMGYNARTTGVSAVALGAEASAAGQGVALGRSAFAEGGSAALGFNSRAVATDAVGTSFLTGNTFGDGTVVSVGNTAANLQRRIVNVADGAQGFDAVNVNQLRAAQTATANLVGGNVVVNSNGSYGGYVIELTDVDGNTQRYTTVAAAINAVSSGAINVMPGNAVIYNPDGTITTAAAILGDQAVNLTQLNAAIDANASRYVSINSTDPSNRDNSGASGANAIAIGPQADADGAGGMSVGYQARSVGDAASALGNDVAALGDRSTAIGSSSQAYDDGTVAIGDRAVANGLNSVVIGTNAQADRKSPNDTVDNAVVIGTDAEVTADNGIAVGNSALASERNAVAQGFDAHAVAESAVATGTRARASGVNALASGTDSAASGFNSIASGTDSRGLASNSVAIGTGAVSGFSPQPGAEGFNINTIAIGNGARAVYQDATAIGRTSLASAVAATSIGDAANASEEAALAVGRNANASGVSSIAQGDGAVASAEAAQAHGRSANASGTSSVAQGDGAIASAIAAQAQGRGATASGISSLAQGDGAQASESNATAVGHVAQATQASATAVGDDARASGINAIAAGHASRASGAASAAFGNDAQATLANTLALGGASRATAAGASAVGSDAQATAAGATALGQGTRATHANSVALGHNAVTAAAVATLNGTIDNVVYTYAGTAPVATVSVGTGTEKRTITNVAAGQVNAASTDAINGSQLFSTQQAVTALGTNVDSLGSSTAAALGGTSAYNPTTHQVTAGLAVGGTQHTSVQSALNQVNATANAGWNVGVNGETTRANVGPGGNVDFRNTDDNIEIARTGTNLVFNLADEIEVDRLTAGDTIIDTTGVAVGNAVKLGDTGLVVAGGPSITTAGINAGGQKITNVAAGTAPTDAVNFSQLANTINASTTRYFSVNDNNVQGGNFANNGATGINAIAIGVNTATSGASGVAIGDGASTVSSGGVSIGKGATAGVQEGDVALGSGSVTAAVVGTAGVTLNGASYTFAGATPTSTVSVGSVGNERTITNVAAGRISATSTDAINGSQLHATNTALADVLNVANAGWSVTAEGANASNVGVNSTTGNTVDFKSADGNIVVSKTAGSNDLSFDLADDLDIAGSVKVGDTLIDTMGVAIGTDVKLGSAGLTIIDGPSVTLAGIDAGNQVITGVAAGSAPTDAVNVSQLAGTVESNRTKYYSVNSTGGGNFDNDGATGDDAIAAGKDATAEGDEAIALGIGGAATGDGGIAIGARAQALSLNSLAIGAGAVSSHANSIALGAGSATTIGAQSGYQGAFVGSSDSTGELNVGGRQVTGVAAGSAATDAVNVSQLQGGVDYAINESNSYTDGQIDGVNNRIDVIDGRVTAIEGDIIDIQGDITDIQGDIVDIRGDITDLDDRVSSVEGVVVEVGRRLDSLETGASGPFKISQGEAYVAPTPSGQNASAGGNGAVASGNNSVALGNQSQATGAGSTAIGQGAKATATNSTALGQGATASHANSVALGAGSATTVGAQSNYNGAYVGTSSSAGEVNVGGRTISGVAPGIAGTDAVNVNQLTGGVNQAINVANQYTDGRITQIQDDMWSIERGYRGATSSAMAMASLPQAYLPGKSMLAVGVGGYQSEYGMAVGLSGITENGRYVYRAQASGNTARDWGFSVGAGIQW